MPKSVIIKIVLFCFFLICLIACEPYFGTDSIDDNLGYGAKYQFLYNDNRIVDVIFEVSEENLRILLDQAERKQYVVGNFIYDGEKLEGVGIRTKGNSSLFFVREIGSNRFSFKVDFHEFDQDKRFHGLEKMNFHNVFKDPSYLREKIAYDLFREAGVKAPLSSFVNLYINNEYFGLYISTEQVDKDCLKHWFRNIDGNLYKPDMFEGLLIYNGDDPRNYNTEGFNLKTNEDIADYSHLIEFIKILNSSRDPDYTSKLETIFDVEEFLKWLAVNTILVNLDSYAGEGHNYYLYDDPESGKFFFIPWDANEAFGNFCCDSLSVYEILNFNIYNPVCRKHIQYPLIHNILEVPSYRDKYIEIITELTNTILSEDSLISRLYSTHDFIKDQVYADPKKLFTYDDFVTNLTTNITKYSFWPQYPDNTIIGLTYLVEERLNSIQNQLQRSTKTQEEKK